MRLTPTFLVVAAAVMGDGCILAVYNVCDGWWGDDDTWVVVEDEDGRQWAPAEPPTASHISQ